MTSPDEQLFLNLPARVAGGLEPARGVGEGWVQISYETESFQGVGLAAGARSGAPELVLDLGLRGMHTLYLGFGSYGAARVWLDGDKGYREFQIGHGGDAIQEVELYAADMTGRKVHVALRTGLMANCSFLAWIRAVPVAAPHQSARNLVGTNDGWSWIALEGIEGDADVRKHFEALRDSDFGLLLWGPAGADLSSSHRTKVGTVAPLEPIDAYKPCDRMHAEQLKPYLENGGDMLNVAVESARDVGVKIHFYIRPEAFYGPFPLDGTFDSRFFMEHPEFHCRDEFGDEIMRLSYAYPAVQDHMLAYFRELLEYGPDGLCFAFNRSLPMMICEQPVVDQFIHMHGRLPNLPSEVDGPEMKAVRAKLMTEFLLRVRALLDEYGLEFTAIVLPDLEESENSGLDVPGLVELNVFDALFLHNGGNHAPATASWNDPYWLALRDKTRLYINGWDGTWDHASSAQFVHDMIFQHGFAGAFFWDLDNFTNNPYNFRAIRRGGTANNPECLAAEDKATPLITQLVKVQGQKLGRYHPGRSY